MRTANQLDKIYRIILFILSKNVKTWLAASVFILAMSCTAAGQTIYVDADASAGGNGQTWATAYKYLQDALYKPPSGGDQIWVAEGTYYPDEDEGGNVALADRTATFQLINGVAIRGGYAGAGVADPNERDIEVYDTILSGDINTRGDNSDNSYHVVTGSGTDANAILDGFTITAGNANGLSFNNFDRGGGMVNISGSPTVTNCTFSANSASASGGGMCNINNSTATLTNCTFSGNSAGNYGGGMYNLLNSSPMLTNCTFTGNLAGEEGGGMFNNRNSPAVTNCTFSCNSANYGAGMYNYASSSPMVINCMFSGNSAEKCGGGMYNNNRGFKSPTLTNCTFSGNSATSGGGMYNNYSSPTITNCILWDNTAPSGPQIYNVGTSSPTVSYSDVQGGWPGTGNIDEDPLFIGPNGVDGIPGTADDLEDNVHLRGYSPCINAGDPAGDYSGQVDIDNQPRVAYGRVDMGADEVFPIFGDSEPDGDVDFADFARFANHWLLGL